MISPDEIKQYALKWWIPFLQSQLRGEPFVPKQIERIGKVRPNQVTQQFETLQKEIRTLYKSSKNETGIGYWIKTSAQNFRRTGSHELPEAIVMESIEDYVHCCGKKKEWLLFQQHQQLLKSSIPALQDWMLNNTLWLTRPDILWDAILMVCHFFLQNPRPQLYLRQLPIDVHTKFIEENATLIQSLLNHLIPNDIRNPEQKKLSERFFLKYDEPLIRMRILDEKLAISTQFRDISIPFSDFESTHWTCSKVLIAENKMNFLTLPTLAGSIAIWSGGGFNISFLKNVNWLKDKDIYYWGDIDEHGFQILHQLRRYYPHAQSVMMDLSTFQTFRDFAVAGERNKVEHLSTLNAEESEVYVLLKSLPDKNRLEQEKIPQSYVEAKLKKIQII